MSKPSIPKGTRDFLPNQLSKRKYIFSVIEKYYKLFGFNAIETPSMEKTETLMGKYGEEGDRLIFKIMPRGKKADEIKSSDIKEALRYDLTVPFARLLAQHQNEICFPFKRYQIQTVWRADRPQRGRYREFYQCDADVAGSTSLIYEVEFIQLFDAVLSELGFKEFTIAINNRKILSALAEVSGQSDKLIDITIALDKLDKVGKEGVIKELQDRDISDTAIKTITPLLELSGNNQSKLLQLEKILGSTEDGKKGIEELGYIFKMTEELGLKNAKLSFTPSLARGLNYYTGAIFEVTVDNANMGSICGGGRYDDLTSIFGLKGISGVGISFGADRIYDLMEEFSLFPNTLNSGADIMFVNFGYESELCSLKLSKSLIENNISSIIYPTNDKMKKQMSYANQNNVKWVAMIGEEEMKNNSLTLKNMSSGEQKIIAQEDLANEFKK